MYTHTNGLKRCSRSNGYEVKGGVGKQKGRTGRITELWLRS